MVTSLTSSYVAGLISPIGLFIQQAELCSLAMENARSGMRDYWIGMGEADFEADCLIWYRKMNQVHRSLNKLQSGLQQQADRLFREEEKRRQEEERQRQIALRAQEAYAARHFF